MEPDPTALREPLTEAHDADDELYARLERRHGFQEKATYVCLVLFIMVLLAAALPAMLYWLAAYKKATPDKFLLPVSLIFAGVAIPVSVHGIRQHLTNFWQPVLQVYIVRILWMVPVFALCSLGELACSLAAIHGHTSYAKYASIPAALRDCYEAYTVLNFFYFMATWIEVFHNSPPHKVLQQALAEEAVPTTHTPIVTPAINYPLVAHPIMSPYVWAPWRLDTPDFFDQCRYVILLYATVAPLNGLVDVLGSFSSSTTGLAATLLSPKNWLDFVQFNVKSGASIRARGLRPRRTRFAPTPSPRPWTLRSAGREPRHLLPRPLLLRDLQAEHGPAPVQALLEIYSSKRARLRHLLPGPGHLCVLPRAADPGARGAVGGEGDADVRRDADFCAPARLGLSRRRIRARERGLARRMGKLLRSAEEGAAALAP